MTVNICNRQTDGHTGKLALLVRLWGQYTMAAVKWVAKEVHVNVARIFVGDGGGGGGRERNIVKVGGGTRIFNFGIAT